MEYDDLPDDAPGEDCPLHGPSEGPCDKCDDEE